MRTLYFEDIELGRRSDVGRYLLTREESVAFAQRWDPQPFHVDEDAAARSIYGGLTASSLHLFAICTRLFFDWEERIAILAMLGKDAVRFPSPARPGEELRYATTCTDKRESRSKLDRGIVTLSDELRNPRGDIVLAQQVSLLVSRRPAGADGATR
jgi:acyl dehydratase